MSDGAKILAVVYGETEIPESMAFAGGSASVNYPIKLILYAVMIGERRVLIDAGCDTMPGFTVRGFAPPAVALERAGLPPEQVTDVILTHAHHDHIDGVRHFPNARIHIQRQEAEAGQEYLPQGARVHTFEEGCVVAGCLAVRRIGGHTPGSCVVELEQHGVRTVFCGDECYLPDCLARRIPTGASCDAAVSRAFVEQYGSGGYRPLLSHDPGVVTGWID